MPSVRADARRFYELSEEIEHSLHRIADESHIDYVEIKSMYKTMIDAIEKVMKPQQPKRVVRI